jgi:hypothetical protein
MALQQKLSPEELEKKRAEVMAIKKANEEREQKELQEKSAIFRKLPGKILKLICVLSALISLMFLVDGFLSPTYTKHPITDAEKTNYAVVTRDGYAVTLSYFYVSLNEEKTFSILMYKKQYEEALNSGYVEVGHSPITKRVMNFRVGNDVKDVSTPVVNVILVPIALLFISLFWLFIDASASTQTIFFGYFCMVVVPLLLVLLLVTLGNQYGYKGDYEMAVESLVV